MLDCKALTGYECLQRARVLRSRTPSALHAVVVRQTNLVVRQPDRSDASGLKAWHSPEPPTWIKLSSGVLYFEMDRPAAEY